MNTEYFPTDEEFDAMAKAIDEQMERYAELEASES